MSRFLKISKGNLVIEPFRNEGYGDFLDSFILTGLFNCKYVITKLDSDRFSYDEAFKEVYRDDICKIYLYKDYLPRVFFAQKALVIRNEETMLNILKNASFNPRETVLLEEEPEVQFQGGDRYAKIQTQIISYEPNEVTVYNESGKDGFLVLLDSYYPGWKAYVNGRLAKIYRADYLFRAVYLPAGSHTIRFSYEPLSFKIGALASLVTLCLSLCALAIVGRLEKGKKRKTQA